MVPSSDSPIVPFCSVLGLDDRAAHVMSAVGAGDMRRGRGPALGASLELLGGDAVVRTTLAGARIGVLTLGDGHQVGSRLLLEFEFNRID